MQNTRHIVRWMAFLGCCVAVFADQSAGFADEPPMTGPQTESRFPPLHVPPGFKATLFACDPLIEYPSVIAAGPRPDAIFVAIDYMTGLGTEIVRCSEVRLVEDTNGDGYADQAQVVAGGFNSIQGIAWENGTLLVMHAPFLTAIKKGERTDLLSGLGLTPEANPVRLHCANGVTVGHDGWLYLALGDNGCDVQRPEGDRLVLQGGGILRCRPNGRDLHVFSYGLRNIYDVALDEQLNVFVRDNENDGGTYKIRVCHSFHGADHGYPYLYEAHPDEALPPLADLGLGSSAGAAVYLETHFPLEYRGNLFCCEWGKSVVRYPLSRLGSSFTRPSEIEFATGAPDDAYGFKPTDVVVQRDGTLMVSDYADGQRPRRGRGRIYKIAHADSSATPTNVLSDFRAKLDSASYFERCDAQRAIEGQGVNGLQLVKHALEAKQLGVRGRLHAIWIIAHLGAQAAVDPLMKIAESDPDHAVREQAVRAIADLADPILVKNKLDARGGDEELAARLASLGRTHDSQIQLEVIVALGRLRWQGLADWIKETLVEVDPALAHAAQQTLRRSENWPAVLRLADVRSNDAVRGIAVRALAEQHEPAVVDGLIERLAKETSASRQREYADLLARVYKKPGPWVYWGYRPGPRPANTVAWDQTEAIGRALDGVLARSEPTVRFATLRAMQRHKIATSPTTLGDWLHSERDADRVAAILDSLRDLPAPVVRPLWALIIRNRDYGAANRLAALSQFIQALDEKDGEEFLQLCRSLEDGPVMAAAMRAMEKRPDSADTAFLQAKLESGFGEVRAAATRVLGYQKAAALKPRIAALLADADVRVREAAAGAAGKLPVSDSVEPLLNLAVTDDAIVRRACFDSLRQLGEKRAVSLALAALDDRQISFKALECLAMLGGPEHAEAVALVAEREPSAEVLSVAVRALDAWQDQKSIADIQGTSGTLIRWHVSGPVAAESALEQNVSSGQVIYGNGTDGHVVLATKDDVKPGVWLAESTIRVAEPAEGEWLASASSNYEAWLNGKSIFRRNESKLFRIDSDRFSAFLVSGDNRLVMKMTTTTGPLEFHARFRRKSSTADHERLIQAALARAGNAERGRQHFLNVEKSVCLKCHRVGQQGERTGPELTGVGNRFSRIYLVESILEPNRTIAPSFGSIAVLMRDGRMISGVKVAETDVDITLADNQGAKHVLAKLDIEQQQPSPLSTMPDGLEKRFTEQEFVDLARVSHSAAV